MKKITLFFKKNAIMQKKIALFLPQSNTIYFYSDTSGFFTLSFCFGKGNILYGINHIQQMIDHTPFYNSMFQHYIDTTQHDTDTTQHRIDRKQKKSGTRGDTRDIAQKIIAPFWISIILLLPSKRMIRKDSAIFFECSAHK